MGSRLTNLLPKLMYSRSMRYFAVAKVMNQTLVAFAFHPIIVKGFQHIWRKEARIGMLMMSKAPTLTFEFPPIGSNSHFNPSNMVSSDVNFKQDPQPVAILKTWKPKTWKRKPNRHNLIGRVLDIGSCDT